MYMSLPNTAQVVHSTSDLVIKIDSTHAKAKGDVLTVPETTSPAEKERGLRFSFVFVALSVSLFVSALEMVSHSAAPSGLPSSTVLQTAVSTALPTIVHALNGKDFVWVLSAYSLAATALLPASGGMAEVRESSDHTLFCLT